ncbi:MAG TPA: RNA 2',3'-cyclic phosphodiesterase [Stellaceae bacterium]|jgi:RNA 2',3'-cyclic 3'-phosphodiesterase|nr:RNA 2',3'-cyclic phosphodiesterase [Stellaceae bacterium]
MLRLFVGIALPPELKLSLSLIATGVPGAKWVDAGNYHLTLRFIGEIDEGQAEDVDAALSRIRGPRFDVALATVGHFGLRQLWVGVERNEALQHLHDKIESALTRLGLPPDERRYTPHVTLARLKGTSESRVQAYLSQHALYRAPPFRVEHFSLIASYLTKSGAIYEDQADYPLG